MDKLPTRTKVMLGLLVTVAVFYVYTTFFSTPVPQASPGIPAQNVSKAPAGRSAVPNAGAQAITPAAGSVAPGTTAVKKFEGDWGKKDPFFRKVTGKVTVEIRAEDTLNLVLSGVHWLNNKKIAVINNITYREDDIVEGKTLVKVEKDYVVLRDESKEYIIKLGDKK